MSSALFNMDRRLLFSISGSNIFKPGRHHSHHGVFAAVLLLLGGIETNPGLASQSNSISSPAKRRTVSIGCLNCRSAANKIVIIHDLINDNNCDILFLSETWTCWHSPRLCLWASVIFHLYFSNCSHCTGPWHSTITVCRWYITLCIQIPKKSHFGRHFCRHLGFEMAANFSYACYHPLGGSRWHATFQSDPSSSFRDYRGQTHAHKHTDRLPLSI